MTLFKEVVRSLGRAIHTNAVEKGFWEAQEEILGQLPEHHSVAVWSAFTAQKLQLIGDEISEANEALRDSNPPSEKIENFSMIEEELADVVIRILDLAVHEGWDIAGAIEAKMKYNKSRPRLHGRKF